MPRFPRDFTYSGQPLDNPYIRYCIRGHVTREEDKAYYWPQMKRIFDVVMPVMDRWYVRRLNSDQALDSMIGAPLEDGTRWRTLRKAPVGGLQRLTEVNLELECTRYLSDNAHLVAHFEGKPDWPFFTKEHPECVYFFQHEIMGQKVRVRYAKGQVFQFLPHDLHITVGGYEHQYNNKLSDPINQAIDFYVCKEVVGAAAGDALARTLGEIAQAKHIWRAESGFMGPEYTDDEGELQVRYHIRDIYEGANKGKTRFGSRWRDMQKA
jgi:hypothetical protein